MKPGQNFTYNFIEVESVPMFTVRLAHLQRYNKMFLLSCIYDKQQKQAWYVSRAKSSKIKLPTIIGRLLRTLTIQQTRGSSTSTMVTATTTIRQITIMFVVCRPEREQ